LFQKFAKNDNANIRLNIEEIPKGTPLSSKGRVII
jgi:hypothetical protein